MLALWSLNTATFRDETSTSSAIVQVWSGRKGDCRIGVRKNVAGLCREGRHGLDLLSARRRRSAAGFKVRLIGASRRAISVNAGLASAESYGFAGRFDEV